MDDPPRYSGNLFPCDIVGPDGVEYLTCRVIAGADGTTVWGWSDTARTGVALFVSDERPIPAGDGSYVLPLDDDTTVDVFKRQSCGCGHPMKRWVPPGPTSVGT